MGALSFEARCVAVADPEGLCHLVGFADEKFDTQLYLILQRAFEDDEQDIRLGMDTFHVEWCGQENSGYGGITRFVLQRGGASISFGKKATEFLGGLEQLRISFDVSPTEFEALRDELGNIFKGTALLIVADA